MEPIDIRHAIEKAGYTQAQIARDLARKPQNVHRVIAGIARCAPVEAAIAALLEKPLAEVFPQWHGPNRRRRSKHIPLAARLAAAQAAERGGRHAAR